MVFEPIHCNFSMSRHQAGGQLARTFAHCGDWMKTFTNPQSAILNPKSEIPNPQSPLTPFSNSSPDSSTLLSYSEILL